MKIKKRDVLFFLLIISLFKIIILPKIMIQSIKIIAVSCTLVYITKKVKIRELINSVCLWGVYIVLSTIINYFKGYVEASNILDSILQALSFVSLFYMFFVYKKTNELHRAKIILIDILWIYTIMSVITIIINGKGEGTSVYYFAGNKFRTCYYMLLLVCVLYSELKTVLKKNIYITVEFWIALTLSILVAVYVKCSTAIICEALFLVFMVLPKTALKKLLSRKTIFLVLIVTGIVWGFLQIILQLPVVQHVVVGVLHKDIGLTGRFAIYNILSDIIYNNPMWGYGYGNSIIYSSTYGMIANAQNNLMQIIVDFGIIGLLLFINMFYFKLPESNEKKINYMCIFIYLMLIAAIVEITFDFWFFVALFLSYFEADISNKQSKIKVKGIG